MNFRKLHSIPTVDIHFAGNNPDLNDLALPTEIIVESDFTISFEFEGKHIEFGIDHGWKNEKAIVKHLYNFRTPRYITAHLQVFEALFGNLQMCSSGENHYLGLPDGRGHFTLTPFLLQAEKQQFLGYYLYEAGSDGESRGEPTPDRILLGELVAISAGELPNEMLIE